jgi:prevent-host-death family protein
LLERVANGERITITKHGVPVAMLVPIEAKRRDSPTAAVAEIRRFRKGRKLGGASLRKMVERGRR